MDAYFVPFHVAEGCVKEREIRDVERHRNETECNQKRMRIRDLGTCDVHMAQTPDIAVLNDDVEAWLKAFGECGFNEMRHERCRYNFKRGRWWCSTPL